VQSLLSEVAALRTAVAAQRACSPGAQVTCTYGGPPGTGGVGPCKPGTMTCAANGTSFGACVGQVVPTAEVCGNAIDENCDGVVDDGCVFVSCAALPGGSQTGEYWLDPDGAGPVVQYRGWCNTTFLGGGWLDVVRTFALPGINLATYRDLFFVSNNAYSLTMVTGTTQDGTGLPGLGIINGITAAYAHTEGFHLKPVGPYSRVRLAYRMQGCDSDASRCSNSNWIPLNGPGWNGGSVTHPSPCLGGYTCIQGSCTDNRDAPIAATYANDAINSANTLLSWSGSGLSTCVIDSCGRDATIPNTAPITWFTQLMLRA
jgi:hypothetical protein